MSTDKTADNAESAEEPTPLRRLLEGVERARRLAALTLVIFVAGTGVSWVLSQRAFDLLALPLTRELAARGQDPRLVFTGLTDPFILYFSVSLFGGLLIASPLIAPLSRTLPVKTGAPARVVVSPIEVEKAAYDHIFINCLVDFLHALPLFQGKPHGEVGSFVGHAALMSAIDWKVILRRIPPPEEEPPEAGAGSVCSE